MLDLGAHTLDPADDYPDFAAAIARAVAAGEVERGVLICGSGVGASIAANKIHGVRAAICHDTYSAHQGVEHDEHEHSRARRTRGGRRGGARAGAGLPGAKFSGEPRHLRRLKKVKALDV